MHARDFKTAAQQSLKNNWGIAIGAMAINSVIISAISYLSNGTPAQYWWISTLCGIFIAVPITVGIQLVSFRFVQTFQSEHQYNV